jgi:hypothetical protein
MGEFCTALSRLRQIDIGDVEDIAVELEKRLQSNRTNDRPIKFTGLGNWSTVHLPPEGQKGEDMLTTSVGMREAANSVIKFALSAREMFKGCTRVYIWRDGFAPMLADMCLSSKEKAGVTGAMVSRSTIGWDFFYGEKTVEDKKEVRRTKANPTENSIVGMVSAAQSFAVQTARIPDRGLAFHAKLRELVGKRYAGETEFRTRCDQIFQHLENQGALDDLKKGVPVVFIDTGYRDIPAFLKALVEIKCSKTPKIEEKVAVLYHTVEKGFEFMPNIRVGKSGDFLGGMNEIGSYASFIQSGAEFDINGKLRTYRGDSKRTWDSIVFSLLLVDQILNKKV